MTTVPFGSADRPDDSLRAGTVDRERVADALREAFAEGRLEVDELDQRLAAVYRAKTLGELRPLTADLPVPAAQPPPARQRIARAPRPSRRMSPALRASWVAWACAVAVNVAIWLAITLGSGGEPPYFWPIWVALPWGAVLLIRTVTWREGDDRDKPDEPPDSRPPDTRRS
jgi:Domain of unknown function (DUF1707)